MHNKSNKYFYIFIIAFMMLEGLLFALNTAKIDNQIKIEEAKRLRLESLLANIPIQAKAYSIFDISLNQKLYGKNDNVALPLASLAKTMSLSVALSNYKDNREVVISKKALSQNGDFGLLENEKWNMDDLAKLTLVCSANDGIYAITEKDSDYLNKMNSKAKRLGLFSSRFLNSTGLDLGAHQAGAYGSAEDANQIAIFAMKAYPNIFGVTKLQELTLTSDSGITHTVKNTDIILNKIPNIIFSKTGFTGIAGGNLTIIYKNKAGHDIAITVLGSTFEGRFTDMEKLVNALELSYTN